MAGESGPRTFQPIHNRSTAHLVERKTGYMLHKANGKKRTNSGNGGTAVLDYDAVETVAASGADRETQRVSEEIARLVEASRQGRLEERGRLDQFDGIHRDMLRGINDMLDAILLPIGVGNRILAQISAGKIDELIGQTYQGDHEKMKQAVNNIAIVVQSLQKEMARLTDASKEGQLSDR